MNGTPLQASALVFAPSASGAFGALVADALGIVVCPHQECAFGGGELKTRSLKNVRGRSVYVIQSLFGDSLGSANDRLCNLIFFAGALKDAGAARVTVCVPYLAYARQDRRTDAHDPVITRYVAQMIEAVRTDRVIALDVHSPIAFDNAFRCEAIHLEAATLFARHFFRTSEGRELSVLSPDIGGAKRAKRFQELLQTTVGRPVNFAFMDKARSHGVVSGDAFAGEVSGRQVIILDDLISSGTTVLRAIAASRRAGAIRVDVAATHASFVAEAHGLFGSAKPDSIVVTDSVPLEDSFAAHRGGLLTVLSVAPLFAEAIRKLEAGGSGWELAGP
jgi:ribose-phosphate pyrophosphokinase